MLPEINLLPEKENKPAILYYIFISGLVISVLFSAFMVYSYFQTKGNLKDATVLEQRLTTEKTTYDTLLLKDEVGESVGLKQVVEFFELNRLPTSILVSELMLVLPENSYFNGYKFDLEKIEIEAQFETMEAISTYTKDLEALSIIENVHLESVKAFDLKEVTEEADPVGINYNKIPRYDVTYTFILDNAELVLEAERQVLLSEELKLAE